MKRLKNRKATKLTQVFWTARATSTISTGKTGQSRQSRYAGVSIKTRPPSKLITEFFLGTRHALMLARAYRLCRYVSFAVEKREGAHV